MVAVIFNVTTNNWQLKSHSSCVDAYFKVMGTQMTKLIADNN